MEMTDYRKRCYDAYVSSHWKYFEDISQESFRRVARVLDKNVTRFLPKDKNAAILDVACGPGHLLHFLQDKGYTNTRGVDLGEEQVKMSRELGVKNVEQGDLMSYLGKYKDEFDMIFALSVIEHLTKEEAIRTLDLIYNALKPKGRAVLFTCNAMCLFDLECTFGDFTHEIVFTPRSFTQLLRICKFSNVQVCGLQSVAYDFKSALRVAMWNFMKTLFRMGTFITVGMGRGIWKVDPIFESMIIGVGEK